MTFHQRIIKLKNYHIAKYELIDGNLYPDKKHHAKELLNTLKELINRADSVEHINILPIKNEDTTNDSEK